MAVIAASTSCDLRAIAVGVGGIMVTLGVAAKYAEDHRRRRVPAASIGGHHQLHARNPVEIWIPPIYLWSAYGMREVVRKT
ncbi:hypothetical protein UA08_02482 [Talaromyces atroroseus]|uniref:Uncharacterized protein n=1 Tax=Talaromyces atroroseus TaxID=1441469 RepID=A0A225AJX3_TALAT|nr:hypothetical protein UA08_02482 [Talaromyces atroroseus]OKL61831.1 hypothetical protein UA08_02482 [Talaromyces atroroseus]